MRHLTKFVKVGVLTIFNNEFAVKPFPLSKEKSPPSPPECHSQHKKNRYIGCRNILNITMLSAYLFIVNVLYFLI
jgi:hypothetical protein